VCPLAVAVVPCRCSYTPSEVVEDFLANAATEQDFSSSLKQSAKRYYFKRGKQHDDVVSTRKLEI